MRIYGYIRDFMNTNQKNIKQQYEGNIYFYTNTRLIYRLITEKIQLS